MIDRKKACSLFYRLLDAFDLLKDDGKIEEKDRNALYALTTQMCECLADECFTDRTNNSTSAAQDSAELKIPDYSKIDFYCTRKPYEFLRSLRPDVTKHEAALQKLSEMAKSYGDDWFKQEYFKYLLKETEEALLPKQSKEEPKVIEIPLLGRTVVVVIR
jgi:hypothetical protein